MRARVAYVVLAHKNPGQVVRLLRRLASDNATFLVHVDRRASAVVEDGIRAGVDDLTGVLLLPRVTCYWGGFGMVRATLNGFTKLVDGVAFDHAVLLSGQDYPLRSAAEIEGFFAAGDGRSFMTHAALPVEFWPGGGLPRIEQLHLVGRCALHLRLPWRRRVPGDLDPFGGGSWICLSRSAVEHVTRFAREHPNVVRFFERVLHPDELFFQTILMNSSLADSVVDDHLRYIQWGDDPGSPDTLQAADLERVLASGKLFARKFDDTVDSSVLDLLDAHIERGSAVAAR